MNRREFLAAVLAAAAGSKFSDLRKSENRLRKVQGPIEFENDDVQQRAHDAFVKWAEQYNALRVRHLEMANFRMYS